MRRLHIKVEGEVQGVGFRPAVYRLAKKLNLTGFVCNDGDGVTIEIQGATYKTFLDQLKRETTTLTDIDHIITKTLPLNARENSFTIQKSKAGEIRTKPIPDKALSSDCLNELFDPESHYYLYPFINCTHCGPRYTITNALPYDRHHTSMSAFIVCKTCKDAYENPSNRRHHAQAIVCGECGPQLSTPIHVIADAIKSGKIIALKDLGGYQFICDANNTESVRRLRKIKQRKSKPFAIMTLNCDSAKKFVFCSPAAEKILTSEQRPIVILPKNEECTSDLVAPNLNTLGVMLPYTAIHYLLFYYSLEQHENWLDKSTKNSFIITSANHSDEPIIKDDQQAQELLSSVADLVVSYNRDIVSRVDDSVLNIIHKKPQIIRRARGFTPKAITLPDEIPSTLALGGHLKNTICITRGREAFLSQHIGTLNNTETLNFYHEAMTQLLKILNVKPECIACDLHPDFYSTKISSEFALPVIPVQHHHAHLASCAVENSLDKEALGIALDGFGLSEEQESWGGELLHYHKATYKRLGSLKPIRQPGGDIAAKQPWRMAASLLFELGLIDEIKKRFKHHSEINGLITLLSKKLRSPLTSSCGRLFDAASALLGICDISNYEGQVAMELESRVTNVAIPPSHYKIENNTLNLHSVFKDLLHCQPNDGANLFHATLIAGLSEWIIENANKKGLINVLMSGGCFLNKVLTEGLIDALQEEGLTPLFSSKVPTNDGGISLGQAWVAGNTFMESR